MAWTLATFHQPRSPRSIDASRPTEPFARPSPGMSRVSTQACRRSFPRPNILRAANAFTHIFLSRVFFTVSALVASKIARASTQPPVSNSTCTESWISEVRRAVWTPQIAKTSGAIFAMRQRSKGQESTNELVLACDVNSEQTNTPSKLIKSLG